MEMGMPARRLPRQGKQFDARLVPASRREAKPLCPRCDTPMVKMYIECDDHSGWIVGFTCSCYDRDVPPEPAKVRHAAP